MKIFVVLVACFVLTNSENRFNGLLSPPLHGASFSTDFGNVEIASNGGAGVIQAQVSSGNGITGSSIPSGIISSGVIGISGGFSNGGIVNHISEKVPIPVPQHVPIPVNKPVPVSVPVPNPVNVPRPFPVPVPQPIPVTVNRPYPVHINRPIPVPIQRPIYINVPHPVQVPVAQPFPFVISHPFPFHVPAPLAIPLPHQIAVPISANIVEGSIISGGHIGDIGGFIGGSPAAGHVSSGPIGVGQIPIGIGSISGGFAPSGRIENYSGSGSYSNIPNEYYGGQSFPTSNIGAGGGSGQVYAVNGGYKY